MLNDEILELRRKLDESVKNNKNSKETYELSIKLDKLISEYYKDMLKKDKKNNNTKDKNQGNQ